MSDLVRRLKYAADEAMYHDRMADLYWQQRDEIVLELTDAGVRALDIQVAANIGPSRLAQILKRERRRASIKQ